MVVPGDETIAAFIRRNAGSGLKELTLEMLEQSGGEAI